MPNPIGSAVPVGLPGGTSGYFQLLRPSLDKIEIPGAQLHPSLITALQAGTALLKYGTLIGRDKTDTVASGVSQCRFKIVTDAAPTAWEVLATNVIGGIHPVFNNGYDPGVQGAGTIAYPFASWYDAQTDNLTTFTGIAVGDYLTADDDGKLKEAASTNIVVAQVLEVIIGAQAFNGSTPTNVITARFLGTASGLILAP